MFRHTGIHRRSKRNLFERRDAMLLLQSSFVSNSSMGSNPRLDIKESLEIVEECRRSFIKMAFPYLRIDDGQKEHKNYDEYFDELDAIEAQKEAEKKADGSSIGGNQEESS
jgi:hypothetical protein